MPECWAKRRAMVGRTRNPSVCAATRRPGRVPWRSNIGTIIGARAVAQRYLAGLPADDQIALMETSAVI